MARIALFLVVLGLALSGCAKREFTTVKTDLPDEVPQGWRLHTSQEGKFSLAAPTNWVLQSELQLTERMDMGASDPDSLQNISNPAVSYGLAPAKESSTKGAGLLLINRSVRMLPGEPRTQLTVKHLKVGGGITAAAAAKEHKSGIRGAKDPQPFADNPIGTIMESYGTHKTIAGDEIFEMQYVVVNKEDVYLVRFVTTGNLANIEPEAKGIMRTFRVKS